MSIKPEKSMLGLVSKYWWIPIVAVVAVLGLWALSGLIVEAHKRPEQQNFGQTFTQRGSESTPAAVGVANDEERG